MGEEACVFSRFEKIRDGVKIKFRIQECRKCNINAVVDFLHEWYIHEESFDRAAGIGRSEAAMTESKTQYAHLLSEEGNKSLICCIDNDNEELDIVGCNILFVLPKNDAMPLLGDTPESQALTRIILGLHQLLDVHEQIKMDQILCGAGLSVNPSYRGLGIATEILKASVSEQEAVVSAAAECILNSSIFYREGLLMDRYGIPVSGSWFTSKASQMVARKAGYKEIGEISYDELAKLAKVVFTDVPPTVKFMVLWLEIKL